MDGAVSHPEWEGVQVQCDMIALEVIENNIGTAVQEVTREDAKGKIIVGVIGHDPDQG